MRLTRWIGWHTAESKNAIRRAAERTEAPQKSQDSKESFEEAVQALPSPNKKAVQESFAKYDKARKREVQSLRREVQLYRTLSTTGITAAVFAHESKQPLDLISRNAKHAARIGLKLFPRDYAESLAPPIGRILRQTEALRAFGSLTLSQIASAKRRSGRVDIHEVVSNVLGMFKLFVADRHVSVSCDFAHAQPYLRGSEAAIESIVTNLLANSLRAFEQSATNNREILIRTSVNDGTMELRMMDSGPGIRNVGLKDIWLPGETTYPNGTGLGLTIVRDTVKDLGGSVQRAR